MKTTKSLIGIFVFIAVLLVTGACSGNATTTSTPLEITPPDVSTNTPTAAPVLQTTETPIVPTVDPVYFRDDFDDILQPGWTWLREIPGQWSLDKVPGSLRIAGGRGSVNAETMTNILLRPAPAGDFQIETILTFEPDQNFQFAGLVVYQDNNNFIQAGQGYCRGGGCVSRGLYMNYYGRGLIVPPNFAQSYKNNAVVLRLTRKATSYIFEISGDGKVFYKVGAHESDMTPLQVGVLAGQNVDGISTTIPALFDYFEMSSPAP
ncbi:MAG TPA: DUF1349 domain-containing protein [Anaerolineales bacterium]|nr:DUF1349 domain-containing protein [Anaerolineales bacterium]HMZ41920.1 DUF1349 domain-containing protein [Anaerolineales bacterium]HNF34208.1 DUF1349 domain-containing protein [Anaerolineales bacterium]HNH04817.1 DUF1349 domain-containing protein [Anaerolineales bacterium]